MVDFTVKNQDLINLLTRSSARGVISISNTEKITATFFKRFFMEASDNKLEIKALDTQGGTMWGWHTLTGVKVDTPGKFAVTDADLLLELLKSISGTRKINFCYEEDEPLTIFTADEGPFKGFELKEWVTMTPKQIKNYNKNVIAFIDVHSINKESIPGISKGDKSSDYSTIIQLKKSDLSGIISQTIRLTKDQDIAINMDADGNVTFTSGKANALIKAKDTFFKIVENPIKFHQKFGNLQPIVPHLFDNITMYMRIASDKKVKMWVRSKSGAIELNFITGAI